MIGGLPKVPAKLLCCACVALQLVAFMRKEEELLSKFPGLDLQSNLQQGSSAAVVTAMLGDTHTNASAAAAAAAAMGDSLGRVAAVSSAQQELLSKYPGLDLQSNLQQGSSVAAVAAMLGDTHTNASAEAAAAAAAAAMGNALGRAVAASSSAEQTAAPSVVTMAAIEEAVSAVASDVIDSAIAAADPAAAAAMEDALARVAAVNSAEQAAATSVVMAAREEAISAMASAVIDSTIASADPALAGLSNLVAQLAAQAGLALQHVLADHAAGDPHQPRRSPQQQQEAGVVSPEALLAQLQALQQQLPGQHNVAGLLADYQAWLDQLKGCLLEQHQHTEVGGTGCNGRLAYILMCRVKKDERISHW